MIGVIGGGVQGLTAAWRLARMGHKVTLYERGRIGALSHGGASPCAAAMLAATGEGDVWHQKLRPLFRKAKNMWQQFATQLTQETNIELGYQKNGLILFALDFDEATAMRHRYDDMMAWKSASEIKKHEPFLADGAGGFIIEDEASVDAGALLRALCKAIEMRGGHICEDSAIEKVEKNKDGFILTLDGIEREFSHIVLATGAWHIEGAPVFLRDHIRPVKGQILTLAHRQGMGLSHMVYGAGCYLVPKGTDRLMVGASVEEVGFDVTARAGVVHELLARGRQCLPMIDEMELLDIRVGLRPASFDGMPLVGECEGFFVASGHYRNGILLAPLTAHATECWMKKQKEPYQEMNPMRFAQKREMVA